MQMLLQPTRLGLKFSTLVVAVCFIFLSQDLMACRSIKRSIPERFDEAKFAFSAEVIAAEKFEYVDPEELFTIKRIRISLGPRSEYKDDSSQLKYVYTNADGATCGISITIGKIYTLLVDESGVIFSGDVIDREEWSEFYNLLLERGIR
jgi:hypothetical protein